MSINQDHSQHRRGLVLGLTVAESMLLIVFALLLALGSVILDKDSNIASLAARLVEKSRLLEHEQARVEVLSAAVDEQPTDKFITELVRARQIVRATTERERKLEEREKRIQKEEVLTRALARQGDPERLKRLAALGARIEEEVRRTSPETAKRDAFELVPSAMAAADAARSAGLDGEQARRALLNSEQVMRENSNLKGRVVRMRKALQSVGKGGDYPPCWVTPAGEIEYLFNVGLQGDGSLSVTDAAPAARFSDRAALKIPPGLYSTLGRSAFLQLTSGLYAYEKQHECRFYVRAIDRTGPSQKKTFKDSLLTVEARFYKVLL